MPGKQTTMLVSPESRDALKRYKLRVAGDIGRDFAMHELIPVLIEIAEQNHSATVKAARRIILGDNQDA